MKPALSLIALIFAAPVVAANQDAPTLFERDPLLGGESVYVPLDTQRECADVIEEVREERGQPALDRGTADANEPILFKAVDHRVDGCGVLLVGDGIIRPVPRVPEGALRLQPAQ